MLTWKAISLRKAIGDDRFKSAHEQQESLWPRLKKNLTRPFIFFTKEPIVIFLGLYLTLIYVLVFTFLDGFKFIFTDTYGFSTGLQGTAFVAIAIGVILQTTMTPIFQQQYLAKLHEEESKQNIDSSSGSDEKAVVAPEIRLIPAIICAPLFPASLFWLGWTNNPSITVWSDLVAAGLFGFSLMGIFTASYQYILDSYETNAASALSSITFLRYAVAGGMVIAGQPMYQGLGVRYTMTLMGGVGTLLVPVPLLFWKYGEKIRGKSQFAKKFDSGT